MNDMLSQIEEIQSNVREIKATWGNTVMMLDNIKSALKADRQKAIDDAYDRGYKECFSEHKFDVPCSLCDDYERGLNDAWDAAKKLAMMDTETSEDVTGYFGLFRIMENLTPGEAISKLRAYEEEKNKIHVGDEVKGNSTPWVVTHIYEDLLKGIDAVGDVRASRMESIHKTGRHFDIEPILKEIGR